MVDVLSEIYNACDPLEPATAEYYLDCSAVRGSSALTERFQSELTLARDYLCFLFSGHIGCGKSSELEQLRQALTHPDPALMGDKRYFPVLLDGRDYLDDYDVTPTDILLAIISELAATLHADAGIDLKDNYFVKRFDEIKKFFLSDVEINEGELPLWGAKAKIQRLKKEPTARQQVRETLLPRMSLMLEEINTVFDEARLKLRKRKIRPGEQPYTDIVLILDNLEKIQRIAGQQEGLESQRELFIERAPQLTSMNVHVIYTVPLRLVRFFGPQLKQRYGIDPFVLPMIKVAERGTRNPYTPGLQALRDLLQRRLGSRALEQVFAPDALDFLLRYSGGHVRSLMRFVQSACSYARRTGIPIPLAAAHHAVQQTVPTYTASIPQAHWEKLAQLDLSPDQFIPGGDSDYLVMLEDLSVLEYINGGDAGNPFAVAAPWYAVNPIVRELPQFKAAATAESKVSA